MARSVEDQLEDLRNRFSQSPQDILAQVQVADDLIKDLGAELRYVDGAVTAKLPWSLPQPLEHLMHRILPGRTVMLRPQWKYNYSIHIDEVGARYRQQVSQLLPPDRRDERLREIFDSFPSGFHLVSFPSLERKNVLLHCDIGHEMGHLMAEEYLNAESKDYVTTFVQVIAEKAKEEQKRDNLTPLWLQRRMADRLDMLLALRRRGLEEIMSDLFGVLVLGPASILAMLAFATGQIMDRGPNARSGYYPPWRTRLRFALDYLERRRPVPLLDGLPAEDQRVLNHIQSALSGIRSIVTETEDSRVIKSDDYTRTAYESIEAALPQAVAHLEDKLTDKVIDNGLLYEQALRLVNRLKASVLPNEVRAGIPAEVESILNSGWFYRVTYLRDSPDPEQPDLRTLHRLILRATELAYVHRTYLQWQGQGTNGSTS